MVLQKVTASKADLAAFCINAHAESYQGSAASENPNRHGHFVKKYQLQFDSHQTAKQEWILSMSSGLAPGQNLLHPTGRDNSSG